LSTNATCRGCIKTRRVSPILRQQSEILIYVCTQVQTELPYPEQAQPIPDLYDPTRQYSEGPQGDPFAPQPPSTFFPIQPEQPVLPQKPAKRKKRPRREETCGFCTGDEAGNRQGQPEAMITCDECARSGNIHITSRNLSIELTSHSQVILHVCN
jgi:hypothetical protein